MAELVSTGPFAGFLLDELVALRRRVQLRLANGAPTRVAIAAGMADEFVGKSDDDLLKLLGYLADALHQADPDNYPVPGSDRPGITRANFNRC